MPRPRSLTITQIAEAAVTVIDGAGLPALTMRAVAHELGMSTMALYRYVADREELEVLVAEAVLATVDDRPPTGDDWQACVTTMADRLRAAMGCHPETVPLTIAHRQRTPSGLRWSETVLEILAGAGITGARRVVVFRAFLAYLIGAIQLEHLGALDGPGTAALAESGHPHLSETARAATAVSADAAFTGGLRILLSGLATGNNRVSAPAPATLDG